MDNATKTGGRRPRRRWFLVSVATAAAGVLLASSAWACTLREGTLEVYNETLYDSCAGAGHRGRECSKVVGTGKQTGLAKVSHTGGEQITLNGTGFAASTFVLTWRNPGSSANCHRTNTDGSVVYLESNATVSGPNFTTTRTTPATPAPTTRNNKKTGLARICVQENEFDNPATVVSGQIADVGVTL